MCNDPVGFLGNCLLSGLIFSLNNAGRESLAEGLKGLNACLWCFALAASELFAALWWLWPGPWRTPVQLTLYSRHPSRFIRLDSKAFRAPRWTWGLCSWWAVHIARQPRRLWTDGTPRLNPEVPCQCRSWCTTTVGDVGSIQLSLRQVSAGTSSQPARTSYILFIALGLT